MHKPRMELPAGMTADLVIAYRGRWQIVDRRHPRIGDTVLAYAKDPEEQDRVLVGTYDGKSISDGSTTWTKAIIRGVVIGTFPVAEDGDAETQTSADA